jgi:hypothetical protein
VDKSNKITVYHGSKNQHIDLTGFDRDRIGGEFGGYYGHGVYFSSDKNTSEGYRQAAKGDLFSKGVRIGSPDFTDKFANKSEKNLVGDFESYVTSNNKKHATAISNGDYDSVIHQYASKLTDDESRVFQDNIKPKLADLEFRQGQLYTAKIPEKEHLINFDAPFSKQSPYVQERLLTSGNPDFISKIKKNALGKDFIYDYDNTDFEDPDDFCKGDTLRTMKAEKSATDLRKLGIKGNYHKSPHGDHKDFVIFNPDDITDITATNPLLYNYAEKPIPGAWETYSTTYKKLVRHPEGEWLHNNMQQFHQNDAESFIKLHEKFFGNGVKLEDWSRKFPNTFKKGDFKSLHPDVINDPGAIFKNSEDKLTPVPQKKTINVTPKPKTSPTVVTPKSVVPTTVNRPGSPAPDPTTKAPKFNKPTPTPTPTKSPQPSSSKTSSSWTEMMRDTTVHALDMETTSIKEGTAKIYNIGTSHFYPDGSQKHTEDFIKGLTDPLGAKSQEEQLLDLHSTPNARRFGQEQLDRGIFTDYVNATKDHTTVDSSLSKFSTEMDKTTGKSFILGQNLNFENKMLKAAQNKKDPSQVLSKSAVQHYNDVTGRTGKKLADTDLFKEYETIENDKETARFRFNDLKSIIKNSARHSDDVMRDHLGKYSDAQDKVMESYRNLIEKSATTLTGERHIPIVDLMDIARATYAKAAVHGDMNPEFINHGSSINFMLKSMFNGREELHKGTSDNTDAYDIFKVLTQEYDKYKADPKYRSAILQKVNKGFIDTNEIHESFVRNISNRLEESSGNKQAMKDAINKGLIDYEHINTGRGARSKVYQGLVDALEDIPKDANTGPKATAYMEAKLQDLNTKHSIEAKLATKESKITAQTLKTKLLNKKVLGVVGALVAANIVFSGGRKDQGEYNTYDELYNNQYYGTQFADWQNRNKHHKMSY